MTSATTAVAPAEPAEPHRALQVAINDIGSADDLLAAIDATSQSSMSGVRCKGRSPSHGRDARALRPE